MGRHFRKSKRGSTVSFHDVSYEVDVRKLPWSCPSRITVLSHLSGVLTPGMNAIMGPTGCGKSSLLDVLAGRKNPQNLSGYVLLDGERQPAHIHRQSCGYVVQDNIAVNTLTVRENIAFSAALRLPSHVTAKERKAKVSEVIEELGLSAVADRLLGTEFVRGVSGGERKRTCIGIELITDPLVLYLDEPTTGLDAYTAGSVMKTLKRLANAGRTIVFSIHQPKYSIYRLFDSLTLIADGQMIYHGPAGQEPIDYFHQFGYVLEGYNNPADFLMDTLHGEVPITETLNEDADCDNELNPEEDVLIPDRSQEHANDLPGSLRRTVVQRLLALWRQSELFESCQRMVSEIARSYEARPMHSEPAYPPIQLPSYSACSLNRSSTSRDRSLTVQSVPVYRLLPSRLHMRGLPVLSTRQPGLCGSDVSLRQLTARTASDSDPEVLNPIDSPSNLSPNEPLHRMSNERLLTDPSHSLPAEEGLTSTSSWKTVTQSAPVAPTERPHFFPFLRIHSYPVHRSHLSQNPDSDQPVTRSCPQSNYHRIESNSHSPSCYPRHSFVNLPSHHLMDADVELHRYNSSSSSLAAPFRSRNRVTQRRCNPDRTRSPGNVGQKRSTTLFCCRDSPYAASYCQQLLALGGRQCLSMVRDYKSLLGHFVIQFIIALFLGIIYYDLDRSIESGIQNRTGLFFFTCVQLLFINSSMIDSFLRDRVIFKHETSAGFYRVSAYFFAKVLSEVLPVKALPALLFLPITYLMAGLRSSLRAFLFWELTLTLLTITASGVAFSVSAMVTNFRVGSMLLSMFFVLMMITSGFLINVLSLSFWLSWVRYLSILRFAMNTLIINELVGMQFCPRTSSSHPVLDPSNTSSVRFPNVQNRTTWPVASFNRPGSSMREFSMPDIDSTSCILGEQYLEMQAIEYDSQWAVWQNECGIFIIFLLALLNAYFYLRMMKKYK